MKDRLKIGPREILGAQRSQGRDRLVCLILQLAQFTISGEQAMRELGLIPDS